MVDLNKGMKYDLENIDYEYKVPGQKRAGRLESGLMSIESRIDRMLGNFRPTYQDGRYGIEYKIDF
jgi:hypothetical protein